MVKKKLYLEVDAYSTFLLAPKDDDIGIRLNENGYIVREDIDYNLSIQNSERVIKLFPEARMLGLGLHEVPVTEKLNKVLLRRKALNFFIDSCSNVYNSLPKEIKKELYELRVSISGYYDFTGSIEWDDGDIDYVI